MLFASWYCRWLILLGVLILGSGQLLAAEPTAETPHTFFEAKIRPVLIEHCYACHSAEAAGSGKLKAGLALDTRAAVLQGGDSGPALVPHQPDESLLLKALRHEADVSAMPPTEKLPDEVIADFEVWIAAGADDPRDGAALVAKKGMSLDESRTFWSFVPPHQSSPPPVRDETWPRSVVDRFVAAELETRKFKPLLDAPPADFLRRLHFDLLGLSPHPEEVATFVAAFQTAASEVARDELLVATVERLLASPHFGERWGRHWLDAARYADSNGRDRNVYFFHAWRYRNYVIDAFNHDKPYDQFIREQLAGDLLAAESWEVRDEQVIATAFLALGAKSFEELKPEVFRMDVVDEQIETICRAVLGLSVGCARCHDHKFDPVPTADYYALAGIFRSTEPLYGYGPKGIQAMEHANSGLLTVGPNAAAGEQAGSQFLAHMHKLQHEQNSTASIRYSVQRRMTSAELQLNQPDADIPELQAELAKLKVEFAEWDSKWEQTKAAVQTAMDSGPREIPWTMGVRERSTAEDCRVHVRGETTNLGPAVARGMLQVVSLPGASQVKSGSGRLELAQWITHPEHPLTARVYVNRVWQHLFGRGLVTTPDDFGVNGARPSHPELLDSLAASFVTEGWSTKQLIRKLVLSRTYRLASQPTDEASAVLFAAQMKEDPENDFLWRMLTKRLEAEILRDAILALSGDLHLAPPQPEEQFLTQYNPYREDEYRTFNPLFLPADIQQPIRSVYLPVVRGVLPELFALFDFAAPERTVAQRDESLVPAQSLYFMNNPWVIEQARRTAESLLANESLADDVRIQTLYERAFNRGPTTDETRRALDYLHAAEQSTTVTNAVDERRERWACFCQTVLASAEFRYVR